MSGEQQQPTVQLAELWERTSSRGKPIHERIPLILSPAHFDAWLAPGEPVELLAMPETPEFEAVPVSTWVNSPVHDDARCMEPDIR
jgi:putative SOS response-associated peptidase YedK